MILSCGFENAIQAISMQKTSEDWTLHSAFSSEIVSCVQISVLTLF